MLKLFEEVENIEKNEGVEALTNEKICELCEKYNISMTELKNLVIEILSAGEITGFSDNEKSLENVAGGKMILKKGTATLLAALSTASPFADTFAANPSRKITGSRDVCAVSHKKSTAQKENLKNPAIKALDFTKKIFAEYIPQKQEDAIKYTQKKFRTTPKKAKHAVLAAEAIAATSLIATTGLISHQMIKGNNKNNVIKISSTIGKRQLLEIVTPHKNVIIVHHEPKSDHCRILFLNDEDRIVSNALVSIGDVKNCRNSEKPYFYLSNRNYIRETAFALVNESGYNYFLNELEKKEDITILELENIEDEVSDLFSLRNDQYLKEFKKAISDFRKKQGETETTEDGENQEGVTEGVNELESLNEEQLHQDELGEGNGHAVQYDDDDNEKDEIESSGHLIKIPSIEKTDKLLDEVKKYKNVIIVHHDSEYNHCHILLPDDENGIALNALNNISEDLLGEEFTSEDGMYIPDMNDKQYEHFLSELKKQKDITILKLEKINGEIAVLFTGHGYKSFENFAEEVLNYREEQRRTEIAESSKEQEGFTKEALRDTPNKMIKLKSLSKKEDLLQIVKENQNVIIVHRKENQESQTQTDVSFFLPYKAERNSLLKSFDKYSDFDFHSLEENFEYAKFTTDQQEYKSLLNVFKDKNVTVLELENIKGEVEYLLKPGFCGYVRRKGFAKRVLDAIEQEQQHTPNPIASSSSSDTTTNDQRSISKQTPIRENAIDPSKKSDKQKPGLLQNVVQGLQSWLLPRNWGNHSEDWQKFTQDSSESVAEAIKRFLKEKLQASDLHSCSTTDDIIDQLKEKGISSDEIVLCSFSGSGSDVLFKVSVLNQNSETEKFDDIKLEQKSECKKPDSDWKKEIIEKINEQFQSKSGTPLLIVNDTIMQQLNSNQKLKDDMFSKFNSTDYESSDDYPWWLLEG